MIGRSGRPVDNIPLGELGKRIDTLRQDGRTIIVCRRGSRSYQAALLLKNAGFEDAYVLGGGLATLC